MIFIAILGIIDTLYLKGCCMKILNFFKPVFSKKDAFLNQLVFTKGHRTIVLQEMVHIGEERMYMEINKDIHEFIQNHEHAKIYLEGIYGEEPDIAALNRKMMGIFGIKQTQNTNTLFLKEIYKNVAQVANLSLQSPNNYLKDVDEKILVKADFTYAQMYEHIKDIEDAEHTGEFPITQKGWDLLTKAKIPGLIIKKFIKNAIINKDKMKPPSKFANFVKLQEVILHERNMFVLDMLMKTRHKNIFMTYGAAHTKEIQKELMKKGFSCEIRKSIVF